MVPAWSNSHLIVYTEARKKPDLAVQTEFCLIIFQELRLPLTRSLACKSTFSPLAVTVVEIQTIMPKYRTRMAASIRGENAFPKDDKKLGTGLSLIHI